MCTITYICEYLKMSLLIIIFFVFRMAPNVFTMISEVDFTLLRHLQMLNYTECENDNDCSTNCYCYKISKRCVNFTNCSKYNRAEGTAPARSVAQCGPCLTGYVTETLANGKESPLCQKNVTDLHLNSGMAPNTIICISLSIFLFAITIFCVLKRHFIMKVFYRFRKWFNIKRNAANTVMTTNNELTTVPLEEQSPFIELFEDKHHLNNNKRIMKNEYQTAIKFTGFPASEFPYVESFIGNDVPGTDAGIDVAGIDVPDANTTDATDAPITNGSVTNASDIDVFVINAPDANVPNEGNIVAQLPHNSSNNRFRMEVFGRVIRFVTRLPEVNNIEEEDNARNTTLQQTHLPNSDPEPSPESNKRNNTKKKSNNIHVNQSLNQNIMNVNIFNEN